MVVFLLAKSTVLPLSQVMLSKFQLDTAFSVTVNVPGIKLVKVLKLGSVTSASSSRLKLDIPEPVVVNEKSWALSGTASLMIVIDPLLVVL